MSKVAVIPVRSGSKRLPKKNYRSFNSRNLAEIARDKCIASGIFDRIIISSDDLEFKELINEYKTLVSQNRMVLLDEILNDILELD